MNTLGKILVILNLVLALVAVGFLGIDFATRTNWKTAYDQLKNELTVTGANSGTAGQTLAKLNQDVSRLTGEKQKLEQDIVDARQTHKVELDNALLLRDDAVSKIAAADLNTKVAQAEGIRLKEETKGLHATIGKREQYIAGLQDENKKLRTEAQNLENAVKSATDRSNSLLIQVQNAQTELSKAKLGTPTGGIQVANGENPPTAFVQGKIETVDPSDKTLVKISVGSDQGLMKNHTLVVYRMSPTPQYLGTIRIVETDHHQAVGRLMRSGVVGRTQLREGDTVASSLDRP